MQEWKKWSSGNGHIKLSLDELRDVAYTLTNLHISLEINLHDMNKKKHLENNT